MRKVIAEKMAAKLTADAEFDMKDGVLMDGQATGDALATAMAMRRPAFVLTSSHGATFPLNDTATMAAQLGLLVDVKKAVTPCRADRDRSGLRRHLVRACLLLGGQRRRLRSSKGWCRRAPRCRTRCSQWRDAGR